MPTPTTKDGDASKPTQSPSQQPSKKETNALKAFRDAPANDPEKKLQLGEEFLTNFPQSRNRLEVVDWESRYYLTKQQPDKLQAAGDRELALTPNNPVTLADVCSNYARALNANTPDLQKRLEQTEIYCKKSLEVLAGVQKAPDASEESFAAAKNQTSALAYSGLGVVAFRKGNYAESISNLDQAVKLDKNSDPVNFYVLGKANEGAKNFDGAVAAFTKCAAIPGPMQSPCASSATEAKSAAASVPK
jgi:tetratricopeptide (TPR) repeat protein